MPAPPEPKWSQPVNGLRLGLSFDPEKFSLGEQVAAQLRFENIADEPIAFYHQAGDAVKRFAMSNDSGQTLKMEPAGGRRPRRRRGEGSPIQTIAPGKAFETQIEEGCSYCHTSHGSPLPALLKKLHTDI